MKTQQLVAFILLLVCLPACGKREAGTGIVGTATGALIGAAVGGKHSVTGAVIGGLLGNAIGSSVGRTADQHEADEEQERRERHLARAQAASENRLARAEAENQFLRKQMQRWCAQCGKIETSGKAKRCYSCGGKLIREKFCPECAETFSPNPDNRYCPYCEHGVRLSVR